MAYFLARYLYKKYKNQGPETDWDEHHEQQQVPNFAGQRSTSSGADGNKVHAPIREKDPCAENRKLEDEKGFQNPKRVPLCEHQLATANGNDFSNEGDVLNGKTSQSPYLDIPDKKRGPKKCPECVAEMKRDKKYRWKLILSLLIPNMMASMDMTITASALPITASHFNKLNQFNWIVNAFTLASTSSVLCYGQMSDVFGRHSVIQAAILFVLIGSVLGAGAQAWPMLLLGRGFQGLGFSGLGVVTRLILSDKVSLRENSKNNTLFNLLNGIAMGVGPVVGGYLTRASWRWCFIINVPIALISHVSVFILLRNDLIKAQPHRRLEKDGAITIIETPTLLQKLTIIDYGGMLLFFFGAGLIVLGLTWGGIVYSWHSAASLLPLITGSILFLLFLIYEYLMSPGRILSRIFPSQSPMIPLSMFRTRDMGILAYCNFSTGMALYSVFYFIGIWFTVVKNYNSGNAGAQLTYYLPGLGVGVYAAMFSCNVWPRMTFWPLLLGCTLEPLGVGMLTWALKQNGRPAVVCGLLGFAGVGTGLRLMPGMLHAVGLRSGLKSRGLAIMGFASGFGGTVGISIMSSVFSNKLINHIGSVIHVTTNTTASVQSIAALPPEIQTIVRGWFSDSIYWAYISILPFLGLAGILSFFFLETSSSRIRSKMHKVKLIPVEMWKRFRICGGWLLLYAGGQLEKLRLWSETS